MFRKPLERLLDRTKKIGKTGLDATAVAQETSIERVPNGAEQLLARFDNALLVEQENAIRQDLNSNRVDNSAERERVLVRHLAATMIYSRFERTYQFIFGSQISMLQELNSGGTLHRDGLKTNYDVATMFSPDFYSSYSFEQWLQFMISQVLVRVDGEFVSITVGGRAFLKFIVEEGKSFSKAG